MAMSITARSNPSTVSGGRVSVVGVRVMGDDGNPVAGQTVRMTIIEGNECGTLAMPSSATREDGALIAEFTGTLHVQHCAARIQVFIPGEAPGSKVDEAFTTVQVHSTSPVTARVDGLSAIALVLILSFAIDRIVRALLFLLSYIPIWARLFPDPELDDVHVSRRGEANRRLVYFTLSATLAIVAIGWFGEVRLLAALGFAAVNPLLDVIVTGLVLTAGADRTERVLQSLGAGSATPPPPKPTPIEITGRLTIDEQGRRTLGV